MLLTSYFGSGGEHAEALQEASDLEEMAGIGDSTLGDEDADELLEALVSASDAAVTIRRAANEASRAGLDRDAAGPFGELLGELPNIIRTSSAEA